MYILGVLMTNSSLQVDRPFSYFSQKEIPLYVRVAVIFNGHKNVGIVISQEYSPLSEEQFSAEKGFQILPIQDVLDEKPMITKDIFSLAEWLAKTSISPLISCLNVMLPSHMKTSLHPRKIEKQKKIHLMLPKQDFYTEKQRVYAEKLKEGMLLSEAKTLSSYFFHYFQQRHWVRVYEEERKIEVTAAKIYEENFLPLSSQQQRVLQEIQKQSSSLHYLFGVTGSGKTEVYLHLAKQFVKKGKQVLILVPEISLTPQMIARVSSRFSNIAFYHSELSDQERYEQYQRVLMQEVAVVVGTRSAVFLPFKKLGLIIIDEEHDTSYKQDNTPCYDARRVAMKRIYDNQGKLLMASATPSLEYYTRCLRGEIGFSCLPQRINDQLPQIELIDMHQEICKKGNPYLSNILQQEIENCLQRRQQAIILLNRRGYAPIVRCQDCGSTLQCQDCDIALSYHQDICALKCHQCGRTYSLPSHCPCCGKASLSLLGAGTKKIEELLQQKFPQARIQRMDYDSTRKRGSHERILKRFAEGQIDILVGTQMISKGLDYPRVTLVGILNGDAGLLRQDYNAAKISFDLLMQASGRSGRGEYLGKVYIQAFDPRHYVLQAVKAQDYLAFYRTEMNYRQKASYPPYSHFCSLILTNSSEKNLLRDMGKLVKFSENLPLYHYRALDIGKRSKKYRQRLLFRHKNRGELLEYMQQLVDKYLALRTSSSIKVDVDPLYME